MLAGGLKMYDLISFMKHKRSNEMLDTFLVPQSVIPVILWDVSFIIHVWCMSCEAVCVCVCVPLIQVMRLSVWYILALFFAITLLHCNTDFAFLRFTKQIILFLLIQTVKKNSWGPFFVSLCYTLKTSRALFPFYNHPLCFVSILSNKKCY